MAHQLNRKSLSVAVMLAGGLAAGSAMAQLEEVVVTAQKRTESLQDVPIAISALDAGQIEAMGIVNAVDFGLSSPNVQMPAYPFSNNNVALFIRGIGNADSIVLTKDPTVGLYYDGVYAARSTGLLADLSDLERVEILRGPQGTLYGRNTTAGSINFINTKPTGDLGFKQLFSAGNYDSLRSVTHIDLPQTAGVSARLSAAYSERDGWAENEGANKVPGYDYHDFYERQAEGYRGALRFDGVEKLLVDYSYDYSDMDHTPAYFQYAGPTGGTTLAGVPITNSFGSRLDSTRTPTGGSTFAYYLPGSETEVQGHNLTISYELSDALTLKSITGYREFDDDTSQNFAQAFGGAGTLETHTLTDHDQLSQELQLIGSGERLNYVAGLYYFNENGNQAEQQYLDRAAVDELGIYAFDFITMAPCGDGSTPDPICTDFANATLPNFLGKYMIDSDVESYAAFGQATWTPNMLDDRLDLTLGLRYTDDEREAKRTNDGWVFNGFAPGASDNDQDKVDYTGVVDFSWTDTVSTYAKVSTGFRSGGSSRNGLDFNQAFDNEDITSYEIGLKSELLDNRLRLNAATFYMEVNDIILDYLPDPVNNPQFVEVFNSGDAETYGLEIDLQAAVTEHLLLGLGYAYLDYDISDAIFPDGSDRTNTTELVWAPEHAVSATADYVVPVSMGEVRFHVDYSWQDDQYALANTDAGDILVGDFGQLNGRISLAEVQDAGGTWQFALWGKNLTDAHRPNYWIGASAVTFMPPRMYGLEVSYEY